MRFAQLTAGQRAELRAALGERVALANPLDYHTYVWGEPDAMAAAFTAMVRGPADLHLLFADLPRADRCADDDWTLAIAAFARACADGGRARGAGRGDGREPDRRAGGRLGAPRAGGARAAGRSRWRRSRPRPRSGRPGRRPAAPPVAGPDGRGPRRARDVRPGDAVRTRPRAKRLLRDARGAGA